MNIPTLLTLFRIFIIPIFIVVYYLPFGWANGLTAILFILAGISDWLDGFLARKLQQTSNFGAFLDPVADKLIVAVALVLLVADPHLPYLALPVAVIICREIAISALREWMAELGKHTSVAVSYMGKVKTTVQFVAIVFLLVCDPKHPDWILYWGYFFLYLAAILTLWSMFIYLKAAWPNFEFE